MVHVTPNRNRRRLLLFLGFLVIALPVLIAALPWIVGIPPVRRMILAGANAALAPTRVELASLRMSWVGPTRMTGLVLRDAKGKAVVSAPGATLDRSLRQLLFDRPRYGTLTLHRPVVDIERRDDGSIDLAEALDPILAPEPDKPSDPETDFTLVIAEGVLRLRSPELAGPMNVERLDMTLRAPAAPEKLNWTILLANPSSRGAETMEVAGSYDQRAASTATADLSMRLSGRGWPVAATLAGIVARCRFDGKAEYQQAAGRRMLSGDARIIDLDATGPSLAGDRLRLEQVGGAWDVSESAGAWTVRRLDLAAPVGSLKAEGTMTATPGASTRISGRLDLAALARQLPHALHIRDGLTLERGIALLRADIRTQAHGQRLDVEGRISDLIARDASRTITLKDPATLTARVTRASGRIGVERIAARAAFLDATGSGDLKHGVTVTGTLDLGALQAQLRELVDFGGLELAGRALVTATYHRTGASYAGHLLTEFRGLTVAGLTKEPLRRDVLSLDAAADGPATASGLPSGWTTAKLGVKGGDLAAELAASSRGGEIGLTADLSSPLPMAGRGEGRFAGRWKGRVLEIDEVRAGIRPADPANQAGSIRLTAHGRLDMAAGDLKLGPLAQDKPGASGLSIKEVNIAGLGGTAAGLRGEIAVAGNLDALDKALAAWTGHPAHGLTGGCSVRVEGHRDRDGVVFLGGDLTAQEVALPQAKGASLVRGGLRVRATVRPGPADQHMDIEATVNELVARTPDRGRTVTLRDPATFSAGVVRKGGVIGVERVAMKAAFLDASGSGDVEHGVKVTGTLDLDALQAQVGDLFDMGGLKVSGRGPLAADYRNDGAKYIGRCAVEFHKLDVVGLAADPIRRDLVRLEANVGGTADDSGLPAGWTAARLGLKAGDIAADLSAVFHDAALILTANASSPLPVAGRDGRAEVRLVGRWAEPSLEIDEARVRLRPDDPKAQAGAIALVARGRFDVTRGDLVLGPIDRAEPGSITPMAEGLRISGIGQSGATMKADGGVRGDLAALDRAFAAWTNGPPAGVSGALSAQVTASRDPHGLLLVAARLDAPDLSLAAEDGKGHRREGPLSMTTRAAYRPDDDRIDLAELALSSRYGALTTEGNLLEPGGRRLADLKGTLTPNWTTIDALVARAIEPGARLRGEPRPFRLRGPLSGGSMAEVLRGLDAELGIDLAESRAFGMKVGPTPVVVRCGGGRLIIDPIATTLNGGRVDLRPELAIDDPAGLTLRLAAGSGVTDAEINDEVSLRVLSYVAPILHEATRVQGHLSAVADRAEFPIGGAEGRSARVDGRITFREVTYGPGPLVQQLITLVGKGAVPALRLDETIEVSVADGRVTQKGLAVSVTDEIRIALDGTVGFDGSLALRAGVPVTAAMLGGDRSMLGEIVGGTRVGVPIGGTLSRPRLDRSAMQAGLRDAGRSMLKRGAQAGAAQLLDRLAPQGGQGGSSRLGEVLPARPGGQSLAEDALRLLGPRPRAPRGAGRPLPAPNRR